MKCAMKDGSNSNAARARINFAFLRSVLLKLLFVIVLMFCRSNIGMAAIGEWTSTNGPEGGRICCLAVDRNDPNTVYAGSYGGGGVYKSTDGGATWSAVGLANKDIQALAIDPGNSNTVYAAAWYIGVFKSTNGGNSWSAVNTGLTDTRIKALAIDPSNSGTLYAGTYGGVFKSSNGGTGWSSVNTGLTSTDVRDLAVAPSDSKIVYAATESGYGFKSTDGGANWNAMTGPTDTRFISLAIDSSDSNTVYVGSRYGKVLKSSDGGVSWSTVEIHPIATYVAVLTVDPGDSSILYAGTAADGVFKSTDRGVTWNDTGLTSTYVMALAVGPTGADTVYAGTDGSGIYKSTNGGMNWSASNTGLTATLVNALAIDPVDGNNVYAGIQGLGLFKSSEGGADWSAIDFGRSVPTIHVNALAIDPTDSNTLYAGILHFYDHTYEQTILKTSDGGANWSASDLKYTSVYTLAVDPTYPNNVYAGGYGGGFYKSTNGGINWSVSNIGITNVSIEALAIDPCNSNTIYAGTYTINGVTKGDGVYKSINGGTSWSSSNSGLTDTNILALAINPTDCNTIYVGTNNSGVFKSTNGGVSWSASNTGMTYAQVFALLLDPTQSNTVYAGTHLGVFRSTNGGTNWNTINTGLTNNYIHALAIDPTGTDLYAGIMDGGVFKWTNGYVISGMVTSSGVGFPGVTINLAGAATKSTTTGSDGRYTFTGLTNGVHTITPAKAGNSFTPQSRSVSLNGADVAGQDFVSLQTGSLKVNLTPETAVAAGARWRVDGGAWRKCGAVVKNLAAGEHTVIFKSVPGWLTPAKQTVTIEAGVTRIMTGIYQTVIADFAGKPVSSRVPLKVKFTDLSTGPVAGWFWDFGDNSTSTKRQPIHTYTKAGTYSVTLTVRKGSCTSTLSKTDYIVASDCRLPGVPSSPSPAKGATGVNPASLQLTWADASDAIAYDVFFGTSPEPPPIATVATPGHMPPALSPGVTYYWSIAAKNLHSAPFLTDIAPFWI